MAERRLEVGEAQGKRGYRRAVKCPGGAAVLSVDLLGCR
jgi:hypothetical protein